MLNPDKIIYGKIITLDDKDTIAEAIVVRNGKIIFVGSRTDARKYKTGRTLVLDYGDLNCIYPGFMDAHIHGIIAANELHGFVDLSKGKTAQDYVNIMRKYIENNPNQPVYVGSNWLIQTIDKIPNSKMLDELPTKARVYMITEDKHIVWVNSKVMKDLHIDKKKAEDYGKNSCLVYDNGEPSGLFSDAVALEMVASIEMPTDINRWGFIEWQRKAFANGYTAVSEAAILESKQKPMCTRYDELIKCGIWKLRTYAVHIIHPHLPDWSAQIDHVIDVSKKLNSEYLKTYGIKLFTDGVVEARSGWMLDDYNDEPGFKGKAIISDHKHMVDIIERANKNDLLVHVHSIGDAATKFTVDAMIEAQKKLPNKDHRNIIAHLECVRQEEIEKMSKNKIIGCVAPLWVPIIPTYSSVEEKYLGKTRQMNAYKIKSFIDAGVVTCFHSDYPGTKSISIPDSIYRAVTRQSTAFGPVSLRNKDEIITRKQALYCFTRNPAYSFREEKRMGTIEVGKLANFTIFDTDFLTCPVEDISKAKVVNTIVDGEIVY